MPLSSRTTWAVLAVALLPQLASAGPITWSYHTEVSYAQDYGSNFVVTAAPGQTLLTDSGTPIRVPLLTSTGYNRPQPGSFLTNYEFTAEVTITDQASGQDGTLHFTGWYRSWWSYSPEDVNNPENWKWAWQSAAVGANGQLRTLDLGDNRYTVQVTTYVEGWDLENYFPSGVMDVEASPTATPEPGTLALAGLGLAGVGLLRARRRVGARSLA